MLLLRWRSRRVLRRTFAVAGLAALTSVTLSSGVRVLLGTDADLVTVVVRLVLPLVIGLPIAFVFFSWVEQLEESYYQLLRKTNELARQARVDPLTGLLNRRAFVPQFELATEMHGHGLFVIGDVDYLKRINDEHGHVVGDLAIQAIGEGLREALPSESLIARIGGDEFCAYLPRAEEADSAEILEAVRAAARRRFQALTGQEQAALSVSFGAIKAAQGMRFVDALNAADGGLYGEKRKRAADGELGR